MTTSYSRKTVAAWVGAGLAFLFAVLLLVDFDNPPDILLFIGRFHPMVVHFPIGFLVVGGLLEAISRYRADWPVPDATILLVLGVGAVSAFIAVVAGFLLSLSGGYSEGVIGWHKWLGIVVAVGSVGAVGLKWMMMQEGYDVLRGTRAYEGVLFGTVGLLLMTGHLGGTLTHGSGYLTQYLPAPVKQLTGLGGADLGDRTIANVDSAVVFTDLVQPVLNDRCVSCHNENKTKGELRLDGPEQIVEGGEDGEILVPGHPQQSEIVRRITLPLYHEDRMPPEGEEPLTVEQTELIRWWIATGASFDTTVAAVRTAETPSSVQTVLARLGRPRGQIKTGIYALDVPPPDSTLVAELSERGYALQKIARDAPFMEVQLPDGTEPIGAEHLTPLEPVYEQIAWLDLSGAALTEKALAAVSEMEHLTRLHLQNSSVSDRALGHLSGLEYLEYLNLYGTDISDTGLEPLGELKNLKTLYLWQTNVTEQGVERWKQQHPEITVNRGASLMTVDSTVVSADSIDQNDT